MDQRAMPIAACIVVTNNYHMPRSLLEMSRMPGRRSIAYPVVNTRLATATG